jgi:hypothetical protein
MTLTFTHDASIARLEDPMTHTATAERWEAADG